MAFKTFKNNIKGVNKLSFQLKNKKKYIIGILKFFFLYIMKDEKSKPLGR